MSKNNSVKDRRKYQRVLVEPSSKILTVDVENHGPTLVFDMSYEGAAFAQPKKKKINDVDEMVTLNLVTEIDKAQIVARTVRVNDEVVAVQFQNINVPARIIIDRVVTDRIVGLNMALIDPKHYSSKADFSFWFHGPKETNLYLWTEQGKLTQAHMEMANGMLIFEDDMITIENKALTEGVAPLNNQQIVLKVLSIVQQVETDLPSFVAFRDMVQDHAHS